MSAFVPTRQRGQNVVVVEAAPAATRSKTPRAKPGMVAARPHRQPQPVPPRNPRNDAKPGSGFVASGASAERPAVARKGPNAGIGVGQVIAASSSVGSELDNPVEWVETSRMHDGKEVRQVTFAQTFASLYGNTGDGVFATLGGSAIVNGNVFRLSSDNLGGRLAALANLYDEEYYEHLWISREPTCPTTQNGGVAFGWTEDANANAELTFDYANVQQLMPSNCGPIWAAGEIYVDRSAIENGWRYTRSTTATVPDLRQISQGEIVGAMSQSMTATAYGTWRIRGVVLFRTPSPPQSISLRLPAGGDVNWEAFARTWPVALRFAAFRANPRAMWLFSSARELARYVAWEEDQTRAAAEAALERRWRSGQTQVADPPPLPPIGVNVAESIQLPVNVAQWTTVGPIAVDVDNTVDVVVTDQPIETVVIPAQFQTGPRVHGARPSSATAAHGGAAAAAAAGVAASRAAAGGK